MKDSTTTPPHVFISQAHLLSYGGSEMVTLELAEHFAAAGSTVSIGTWSVGPPVMSHLAGRPNISYFDIDGQQLSERLAGDPPQLAWIHHQLLPAYLLDNPLETSFVYNHMSSVHPLELSWSADIESAFASVHLYNSVETLAAHQVESSALAFDAERLQIFANPAPDSFGTHEVLPRAGSLRLGVVSNHPPEELATVIEQHPVGVEFLPIGASSLTGSKAERVTPRTFEGLDGVITIGKTVQYAIIAGLPVYCYDKFGGPGWLGSGNFGVAEHHNFSGRGFARKGAAQIAAELVEGFEGAAGFAAEIKASDLSRFVLSSAVELVRSDLERKGDPQRELSEAQRAAHRRQQRVVGHYARNWLRSIRDDG
ncbi:hypothetical protein PTW37_09585 [Arthrobacter agilis]|uniref:hypothetical protein n=1 Tax=Arthrobacter agilis TaxID=37921 RepID=UPI0023656BB8|nr:hypothetical protein [Arthrobacter agilis]WDF32131.1 hypothetical protein PTW37_09585 [Arthrobacter agilis]